MKRDIHVFLVSIVLTAVLVTAVGAWVLYSFWGKMWEDEQRDLDIQAELIADSLMARAQGELGENMQQHRPPPPRRPPPGRMWDSARIEKLKELCEDFRKAAEPEYRGRPTFKVCSHEGEILYSEPDFPESPQTTGMGHLGPPIGSARLLAARADGGAWIRSRSIMLVALCGCLILSVAITLVVGGGQFAQQLRHERRDSQRKTDFIDNISHELKTPLAGIRLNAELLAENRVTDAGKRRLMFDSILRESDRLTRMVDNLLEFGRLAKNHRRYAIKPVDLSEFALDLLHDPVVTMIAAGRLRVVRPEDGAGGKALADSDVLRQIVVNLVENAAKYTTGEIEILTSGSSVTVTDHGPGIPRKYEKRIFERFFRIDNSNSAKTSGSGLGLSIALDLARGMGGDLVYAPREGGGSRFTLTLPTFD